PAGQYVEVDPGTGPSAPRAVRTRFGRERNVLTEGGVVDGIVAARGGIVYVFCGTQYFRFSGGTFGAADTGYPKTLETNKDGLPRGRRGRAGVSAAQNNPHPLPP